jgi:branched-chain amino acid transport system substrate-binding protein
MVDRVYRRLPGQVATAALLLMLGACAAREKPVAVVAPPPPPVVVEAPPPPPPPEPVVAAPRPQVSNAMRIAVLVPMTGGSARIGQAIANAASLAALDLNTSRIRVSVYNTEGSATAAANAALADGAKIILGPLFAAEARAVLPVARAANVPMITFSNDASLADPGSWVLGFQPSQEVQRVVGYARQRGIASFGALAPQGQYGQVATRALQNAAAGASVGAVETYPRDKTKIFASARRVSNYEARLMAARAAAAKSATATATLPQLGPPPFQALLLPETGGFLRSLLPLLKSYGVETPRVRFLGTGLWHAEPTLFREPMLAGAWYAAVPDAQFNAMAKKFTAQYGYAPPRLASLGYDGVLLAAAGARQWAPGAAFPSGLLNAASGYTGVDGYFRFSNNVAVRALEVRELTPAGVRTVSPASR